MDEGETFIKNLLVALSHSDMSEAELSVRAGLNRRAVTDLREGRVKSPKLTTVFSLARAMSLDPGEMMGLGPRPKIRSDLAEALSQYSEEEQARLAIAFRQEGTEPASK